MAGQEGGIAALTAVTELDGGIGAVFMDGGNQIIHGGHRSGVVQNDHGGVVGAGGAMGNCLAHVHQGRAALGPKLKIGDVFGREDATAAHFRQRGGGGDDAVFQGQIPQLKGGE